MTIAELKNNMPQEGRVVKLSFRPAKWEDIKVVEAISIDKEYGIIGDHYRKKGGTRMVTLIQQEHIDAVSQILGKPVRMEDLRRNIVVVGINLLALHDAEFTIGDVLLKGSGYCHPCSRMEKNLGPGGYNAMRGHGGITAVVLSAGQIKVGDNVALKCRM
jgi:MOSC domain-containing protein YiiM